MDLNKRDHISWTDIVILSVLMFLALYVAFIPHEGYSYPVHIDEWVHLAYSEAVLITGQAMPDNPFFGIPDNSLISSLESGFHVLLAVFHQISGISWLTIFRYLPGVILVMTLLSVYVLGRRQGYGWESAFFVCLIPTTVGILGPAFLVPVALGLMFVPVTLFVAFYYRHVWAYMVIFIFTCFLLAMHAPSAVCLVLITVPYVLLNLKGDFKHSVGVGLALILPFIAPFPWIFKLLLPTAESLLAQHAPSDYVQLPLIIKTYGYFPVSLCMLGTLVLALKGGRRNYGMILGLVVVLLMLMTFYSFHYGVSIVYERGLMFGMLMLSIVAGAGLMWIKNIKLPENIAGRAMPTFFSQHLGKALCLVLVGITLFIAIPARQSTPYYNMIDDYDYEAFVWMEQNIGEEYDRAILDPWKATAFTAITGKYVFTRIHAYPKDSDAEAIAFLNDGCRDTAFLIDNGISIIYTRDVCDNPNLTEVRENVYLLQLED